MRVYIGRARASSQIQIVYIKLPFRFNASSKSRVVSLDRLGETIDECVVADEL